MSSIMCAYFNRHGGFLYLSKNCIWKESTLTNEISQEKENTWGVRRKCSLGFWATWMNFICVFHILPFQAFSVALFGPITFLKYVHIRNEMKKLILGHSVNLCVSSRHASQASRSIASLYGFGWYAPHLYEINISERKAGHIMKKPTHLIV